MEAVRRHARELAPRGDVAFHEISGPDAPRAQITYRPAGAVGLEGGEPDIVEDMPFETETPPYQVWTYFSPSLTVVFVDDDGFGLYELSTPWSEVRRVYER